MRKVKIKDLCSFLPKSKIKAGEGLEKGKYIFFTSSDIKTMCLNEYLFDEEAVILGTGGKPSCNYFNGKFAVSTDNFVLKSEKINIKYLYYFLRNNNLSVLEHGFHGAGLKHISKDYVNDIEIPVVDECYQLNIINNLDLINQNIDFCKNQLIKYDELVKSQFIEMFENKAFDKIKLNDLCVFLRNGMSIKQEKNAKGYPITRIETLSNSIFNRDRLGYANIMFLNEKHLNYILEDGDLLISHINSEQFVGRTVQYHKIENEQIIHGMNLLCMRVHDFVNPTYIEYFFKTEKAKTFISSITKRAINQASMASGDLKNMIIDLPPIEEQNEFSKFVQQIDKSKFIVQKQIKLLEELLEKKMNEYFGQ